MLTVGRDDDASIVRRSVERAHDTLSARAHTLRKASTLVE
jgi:hypothetical protein